MCPPTHVEVINVISSGFNVCGVTYSSAKRLAREGSSSSKVSKSCRSEEERKLEEMSITFDDDDIRNEEHHDGLVILLIVNNCVLWRVLLDGLSSANILFKSDLEVMGIDDRDIMKKSTLLVEFSKEAQQTIGKIIFSTIAKGVNLQTRFNIVECPSTYKVFLDTSCIHKMKAFPSTYH